MTVVEQVLAPVVVTERERRARTLEAAALEIEVRGWCRSEYQNARGAVCVRGAIGCATTGVPEIEDSFSVFGLKDLYLNGLGFIAWNDRHARGADDVTFVLRWRAQEIRDGR